MRLHRFKLFILPLLLTGCISGHSADDTATNQSPSPSALPTQVLVPPQPPHVPTAPTPSLNHELRAELLKMEEADQAIRERLALSVQTSGTFSSTLIGEMNEVDHQNTLRMKTIIATYSWPTVQLVGRNGASAAWLLVQHADDVAFQRQCLELLAQAVAHKEADATDLAYLTDRVLFNEGKEQLYGTQSWDEDSVHYLLPVQDPEHLNERRRQMGLDPLPQPLQIKPLPTSQPATP